MTPSVSERHVDEDVEDAEGAEAESTHGSTISKRSRSLARLIVNPQVVRKPVVLKTATSSGDVPRNMVTLPRYQGRFKR